MDRPRPFSEVRTVSGFRSGIHVQAQMGWLVAFLAGNLCSWNEEPPSFQKGMSPIYPPAHLHTNIVLLCGRANLVSSFPYLHVLVEQ
jgi:hypothetical protein